MVFVIIIFKGTISFLVLTVLVLDTFGFIFLLKADNNFCLSFDVEKLKAGEKNRD